MGIGKYFSENIPESKSTLIEVYTLMKIFFLKGTWGGHKIYGTK